MAWSLSRLGRAWATPAVPTSVRAAVSREDRTVDKDVDFDQDGRVDGDDLAFMARSFGQPVTTAPSGREVGARDDASRQRGRATSMREHMRSMTCGRRGERSSVSMLVLIACVPLLVHCGASDPSGGVIEPTKVPVFHGERHRQRDGTRSRWPSAGRPWAASTGWTSSSGGRPRPTALPRLLVRSRCSRSRDRPGRSRSSRGGRVDRQQTVLVDSPRTVPGRGVPSSARPGTASGRGRDHREPRRSKMDPTSPGTTTLTLEGLRERGRCWNGLGIVRETPATIFHDTRGASIQRAA